MLSSLTGRLLRAAGAVTVGVAAAAVVAAEPGRADYVVCPTPTTCYVVVGTPPTDPGNGGGNDGGNGGGEDPSLCPWQLMQPQPPAGDPLWEGHAPGDGSVWTRTCLGGRARLGVGFSTFYSWFPNAPTVTPAQLAQQAVKDLPLHKPKLGVAPDPGGAGLVGLPVWLWLGDEPNSWGTVTATAQVPGLSVTATATSQKVDWTMGDGHTVTCANRGTRYDASYGNQLSPTCGYRYERSSRGQPSGTYALTASVTWQITWAGGGQTGSLTQTVTSDPIAVRIDELQVVIG
jgi:hypothetical protein